VRQGITKKDSCCRLERRIPVAVWRAGTAERHDGFVKLRYVSTGKLSDGPSAHF